MKHGTGEPDDRGLYAAKVNGGWKILEWDRSGWWHYPGTPVKWRPEDVSQWLGPLEPEDQEYDL